MADSSNTTTERQILYYCHNCKCRISSITESFTCPRCNSGFVEEVENSNSQPDNSNDVFSFFTSSSDLPNENFLNLVNEINLFNTVNNVQLGRLLSSVIGNQANGGPPLIRLLHGNPEDYVWSTDGLDTVITQLLNQIDNAGPPPMSQEDINSLNEISVTNDHVNNKLQCPICMEDFILDEKVKELSCHHFFHNDCIVEWLKLHATCPTCRTVLANEENANKTNAGTSQTTNSTSRPENTSTSSGTHNQTPSAGYDFTDDLD